MAMDDHGSTFKLFSDEPIRLPREDSLNRSGLAETLAEQLISFPHSECLVVGVHGPWGSGKTSFLNLLAHEIRRQSKGKGLSVALVQFNPWNFSSIDQLIMMFFSQLSAAVRQGDRSETAKVISRALLALGFLLAPGALVPGPIGMFAGLAFKGLRGISKEIRDLVQKDTYGLKDRLNKQLRECGKTLVVLIDDIDRLDKDSMSLLFRMVRLNADFSNVRYILAFDRLVAERVLQFEQGVPGREYLEKIVQVPFDLPMPEFAVLEKDLIEGLSQIFAGYSVDGFDKRRFSKLYHSGFKHFFKTLRDVKRYLSALSITFPAVYFEVNPIDFVIMENIRVFCPDVYAHLPELKPLLVEVGHPNPSIDGDATKSHKEQLREVFALAGEQNCQAVEAMCRGLFPQLEGIYGNISYGANIMRGWRKERRVCSADMFDKYFLLGVPQGQISEAEIKEALLLSGDRQAFTDRLKDFQSRHLTVQFLTRLNDCKNEIPIPHVSTVAAGLLDAAEGFSDEDSRMFEVGPFKHAIFLAKDLLELLADNKERSDAVVHLIKTGNSLHAIIYLVDLLEKEQDERPVISDEVLTRIRKIALERLEQAAEEKGLSKMPGLGFMLFGWGIWAGNEAPRRYVADLIETDEGVQDLLVGFLGQTHSATIGDYTEQTEWSMDLEGLSRLVDLDVLEKKTRALPNHCVQQMDSAPHDRASTRRLAAVTTFLRVKEKQPVLENDN